MTTLSIPLDEAATEGEPRWQSGRWCWAVWSLLSALAAMLMAALSGDIAVFAEGGVTESLQAGLLLVAVISSIFVAGRLADARCRSTTLMLGVLAALALWRELDMHILLNPRHLGAWGVRFRVDWWFDREVSIALKAFWVGVVGSIVGVLGLLAYRSAGRIDWQRARPRLMVLAVVMYGIGYGCDDRLRGIVDLRWAQAVEETAELIAAAALLGATLGPESAVAKRSVRAIAGKG